jgi:hypothetical protein
MPVGNVANSLAALGVRQWQIELTEAILEAALLETEPVPTPEPEEGAEVAPEL